MYPEKNIEKGANLGFKRNIIQIGKWFSNGIWTKWQSKNLTKPNFAGHAFFQKQTETDFFK